MLLLSWRNYLGGLRGWLRGRSSISSPDQYGAILIDGQLVHCDDFGLQIFEILVIQAKLSLEGPIRDPSLALEHGESLSQDFLKCHGQPSACLIPAPGYSLAIMPLAWLTIYPIWQTKESADCRCISVAFHPSFYVQWAA